MHELKHIEIAPELVRRAQAGDEAAFNQLYEQTGTAIYRTIFSMVQDEDTAWDVHQNSYILAWRGLNKLENPSAFLPWLRRIAVNEAVKELTKEDSLTFSELTSDEDEEPQFAETRSGYQPEIELDKKEAARLVREILEKMPKKQKLIVGMYYYEGYSIKEIAEALNVTQGTVKTQLHLGRKRVEAEVRRLEGEGVKLYGMAPMAFLLFLLRNQDPGKLIGKRAAQAILTKAAATEPVVLTAKAVGSGFFHTALGKLTAVALSAAVVAGGVLGYQALKNRHQRTMGDYRPTETVASTEAPAETQTQTEPQSIASSAFSWSACAFEESVLAVICNEADAEGDFTPTVIWNEGTQDRLLICPRYEGSTVSASRITYSEETGYALEAPAYSTVCGPDACIGAAFERPEQNPAWLITVSTPDGKEGSWILGRNEYGTPGWEFVTAENSTYQPTGSIYASERAAGATAIKLLKASGYSSVDLIRYYDDGDNIDSLLRSVGKSILPSVARVTDHFGPDPFDWLFDELDFSPDPDTDEPTWMICEQQLRNGVWALDTARVHAMYLDEAWNKDLAEKVAIQAERFAEKRMLGYAGQMAETGEDLHFDLHGLLVYNSTLSAKTVSITVNGEDAGEFSLTEGDFFTWIPLEYADLPGDRPVHVELRVVDTYFGTAEQSVLGLIPDLTSIFIGGL